ncbi:cytotoxic translational repressor of toxin-antitoxin stability system [Nostoc sp. PCC 7524]|uniref:type II toxin-antitoxin system RelE family toxin n=1 Tax=Nostoc sp. (strain ATCC 29411 / PCC 7524) TaxID=28072 RepID=UPI00029F20DE|nr:type II toxin-antitoxin system RelE/ParE family toxin [Nostoc sp. PCC 7524]AFY47324.1 cytotoxic translational repressor of toxin-antitoxin stability system [Nostoc sp. PCC 7524]
MSYQVQVLSTAVQQIERLNSQVQQQVMKKLEDLASNPIPEGARNLAVGENLYLVVINEYRIVYHIQEQDLLITVTKVAHSQDY